MGKEWQRRTKALILRSAMLKNGYIQVKSPQTTRGEDCMSAPGSSAPGSSGLSLNSQK